MCKSTSRLIGTFLPFSTGDQVLIDAKGLPPEQSLPRQEPAGRTAAGHPAEGAG